MVSELGYNGVITPRLWREKFGFFAMRYAHSAMLH